MSDTDSPRRSTLIAEDLLLLLLDDDDGTVELRVRAQYEVALAGAVLAELALVGAVNVAGKQVERSDRDVVADPLLCDALVAVVEKPRSTSALVRRLQKGLRDELIARLEAAGLVERRTETRLVFFERTSWPATDRNHEAEVREQIAAILFDDAEPDARSGVLIALLAELGQVHRVFQRPGVTDRAVKSRAGDVAAGTWASDAVRKVLQVATVGALAGSGVI